VSRSVSEVGNAVSKLNIDKAVPRSAAACRLQSLQSCSERYASGSSFSQRAIDSSTPTIPVVLIDRESLGGNVFGDWLNKSAKACLSSGNAMPSKATRSHSSSIRTVATRSRSLIDTRTRGLDSKLAYQTRLTPRASAISSCVTSIPHRVR
jgi:hypothetical protein